MLINTTKLCDVFSNHISPLELKLVANFELKFISDILNVFAKEAL